MKKSLINSLLLIIAACTFNLVVAACGGGPSSSSRADDCPEGYICDTTYTDTSAYSFVYYSGKNKLDTVTAFTGEMTCKVYDEYFSCHLTKTYETCRVVYSYAKDDAQENSAERDDDSDTLIHKTVNVLRVDTTFINYGKRRLIDSIPPYIEPEQMDLKGLQDAFDTVELELYDTSSYDRYYGNADFGTPYAVENSYGTLPDGAGSLTSTNLFYTVEADGDTMWRFYPITYSLCYETVYIEYPLTPKIYTANLYMFSHDPLERDTTVTWLAYYTDMYGVMDSTEITTVFRMKE